MMAEFGGALSSEVLKLKRTLALRMTVVAPALVALLSLLAQSAAVRNGRSDLAATFWDWHSRTALEIWTLFLMPLLIALETTLLSNIEHAERQWKHVFALPVRRSAIYLAKFGIAQALILLSSLLLCALIVLSGWILMLWHPALASAGAPPFGLIVSRALQCWLAAGLILSINLWIALRWPSFTVPLGAGIAGTFFAMFAASARAAKYYPWLLPSNVFSPDRSFVALALGIAGGIVVAALGCIDFCRREESESPQLSRPAVVVLTTIVAAFLGAAVVLDWGSLWSRHASHIVRFVAVDRDVKLEVLDWGGSGRPVVLLAGLGDTAHVFDRFAPKLARTCHVYGITRRGFGASSRPLSGYSADRLGDDVLAVIDSLKLVRPVLAGHSIGGEELSSIGTRHPERVAGLVYLDAAYSYAYYDPSRGDFAIDLFALDDKLQRLKPGSGLRDPRPLLEDVAGSLPGFERVLEQKLKDLDASTAGRTEQPGPGLPFARAVVAGEQKYAAVRLPVLAIYALPHDMGATNPHRAADEARDLADITGPQVNAFQRAMPSARVVRLPGASHYVFQSNEADVLREMKAFIHGLPD